VRAYCIWCLLVSHRRLTVYLFSALKLRRIQFPHRGCFGFWLRDICFVAWELGFIWICLNSIEVHFDISSIWKHAHILFVQPLFLKLSSNGVRMVISFHEIPWILCQFVGEKLVFSTQKVLLIIITWSIIIVF